MFHPETEEIHKSNTISDETSLAISWGVRIVFVSQPLKEKKNICFFFLKVLLECFYVYSFIVMFSLQAMTEGVAMTVARFLDKEEHAVVPPR